VCPASGSWNRPRGSLWCGGWGFGVQNWSRCRNLELEGSDCPRGLGGCDGRKQTTRHLIVRRELILCRMNLR